MVERERTKEQRVTTEEQARQVSFPYNGWAGDPRPFDPRWCCASVHRGRGAPGQCVRKPKHWYGKYGYCDQHDPNRMLDVQDQRDAEYKRKQAEINARIDAKAREREYHEACAAAVRNIAKGHNDPMLLCRAIMRKYGVEND